MVIAFFSCEKEGYVSSEDARLVFSKDTIAFDTIFTTIGSTTKRFTVQNHYDETILISSIKLAGGNTSNFRLNINGNAESELYDVEIPANDSIYVFVEVTVDPTGQNLPMIVQDSIIFNTNANLQEVNLLAYGQDFIMIKGENLRTSTTWTADKPYLVYDYVLVDSTATLTIEPGARIHFHNEAGLYVKGTIIADGTLENPIKFLSDKLDDSYKNVPDQWSTVLLFSGSHDNIFDFVTIKNANIGLQVGTIENEGFASVTLTNSKIENMAYAGLFALKSKILGYNNVITNCGYYAAALLVGGEYEFYHTTIANYWNHTTRIRKTPSLVLSNSLKTGGTTYNGDLTKAVFANSIVYGTLSNELDLNDNDENAFNFLFDHCILGIPDTINTSNTEHYVDVLKGKCDALFVNPYRHDFQLDSLASAINLGANEYAIMYPLDILGKSRSKDQAPDLGAYEYFEEEDED